MRACWGLKWFACRYVTHQGRLSFEEDAKLGADFEEQRRLVAERAAGGAAAGPPFYHFICDCFFLTAKGLHLGLVKLLADWRMLLMARPASGLSKRSCARKGPVAYGGAFFATGALTRAAKEALPFVPDQKRRS